MVTYKRKTSTAAEAMKSPKKLVIKQKDLEIALQEGQFDVYYQPQVNVITGHLIGIEALIRWFHPKYGTISPVDFIPIAEKTGLIIPIGAWVLERACKDYTRWYAHGLKAVSLAVNISCYQLNHPGIVEQIERVLAETAFLPDKLELEITESISIDTEAAYQAIKRLSELGIKICMDDFGTGYSSLVYLRKLPIHKLKIDRTFIKDLHKNKKDVNIVKMIMQTAKLFDLKVIAEGVESLNQLQQLKSFDCADIQGFIISPPLNVSEMDKVVGEMNA